MDKKQQYYEIISNLVQQHRKFPGLENILENIIDDVYLHAEGVLDSIDDEDVLETYLKKIVSISIITVPKALNFTKEHTIPSESKNDEVVEMNVEEDVAENQAENSEQIVDNNVNTDLVDKMINLTAEEAKFEQIVKQEDINVNNEVQEDNSEKVYISADEKNEENNLSEDNMSISEYVAEEAAAAEYIAFGEVNDTEKIEEDSFDSQVSEVENTEFEQAYADEQAEDIQDNFDFDLVEADEESPDDIILDVQQESTNDLDIVEEENYENYDVNIQEHEILLNETDSVNDIDVTEPETDDSSNFEINAPSEIQENIYSDSYSDIDSDSGFYQNEDNNISDGINFADNVLQETNFSDNDMIQIDDSYDVSDSAADFLSEELIQINENDALIDDSFGELNIEQENSELKQTSEKQDFKGVDYSVFSFSTNTNSQEENTSKLVEALEELNMSQPNLQVLKIYDMRFDKHMTILEIAEELHTEANNIINVLNGINSLL